MIGVYVDADGTVHGFLLDNGVVTTIDVPNAAATTLLSASTTAARSWALHDDDGRHGFLLSNGVFTTITVPGAFEIRSPPSTSMTTAGSSASYF